MTPERVREAVARYLTVDNSTTGTMLPRSASPDAAWEIGAAVPGVPATAPDAEVPHE